MIEGYTLHRAVLSPDALEEIRAYLSGLEYTRIERPAMHLWRSLQNDNTNNPQAHHLIALLKRESVDRFIAFDDVSVVRYTAGSDYVDWHSDGGPLLEMGCEMGVISFGQTRRMEFRRKGDEAMGAALTVAENDLVVSRRGFQSEYQHRIPPCNEDGLRYSIVLFTHNKSKGYAEKRTSQNY